MREERMKRLRRQIKFSALLVCGGLAALALCASSRATTLLRMTVAQMAQRAPLIVRARCVANSVGWDAEEIWTMTNFYVVDTWRGTAPASITVRLLGGTSGNLTSSVAGIPRFRPGEEVILFLEPTRRGDFSVLSWGQGTFRIRRDHATNEESVTQDTSSFATFDPRTRRFEPNGTRNLTVSSLRKQIDAALGNPAGTQP
jgi:hypothetical protein